MVLRIFSTLLLKD